MSGVRMCDACGTVFSENAEGVSTGSVYDSTTGRQRTVDYCDVDTQANSNRSNQFLRRTDIVPSITAKQE